MRAGLQVAKGAVHCAPRIRASAHPRIRASAHPRIRASAHPRIRASAHHAPRGGDSNHTLTMAIGLLTLELYLPVTNSLKEKRGILKPLMARLRRDFNISVCEAEAQDMLSRAVLEVVCVSHNRTLAHRQLQLVAKKVENWRLDADLIDYHIEMIE
jgi:uncharacterized protein